MLRAMLHSSWIVISRPAAVNFEAQERRAFGWALLYVSLGATVTALLGWISSFIQRPFLDWQYAVITAELATIEAQTNQQLPLKALLTSSDPRIPIVSNVVNTLIGFLTYLSIIFVLGRLLGGKGRFSELAYDIALFWVPISVASAVINLFSFSLLACFTAPLALGLTVYGLYLTFLSIQSGMNLRPSKAGILMLVPALLWLLAVCGLIGLLIALAGQAQV